MLLPSTTEICWNSSDGVRNGSERPYYAWIGLSGFLPNFSQMSFLLESQATGESENDDINTGWWAWVDLNHRPRPCQDSVVRSCKNLQVPRGLPRPRKSYKTTQIVG